MHKNKAFTLVELMMVIIIISILISIAIPTYVNQMHRSKASKGGAVLSQIRKAELSYFYETDSYSGNIGTLASFVGAAMTSTDNDWVYSIAPASPTTVYTITATRRAGAYTGSTITINQDGTWAGTHPYRPQ